MPLHSYHLIIFFFQVSTADQTSLSCLTFDKHTLSFTYPTSTYPSAHPLSHIAHRHTQILPLNNLSTHNLSPYALTHTPFHHHHLLGFTTHPINIHPHSHTLSSPSSRFLLLITSTFEQPPCASNL